MKKAELLEKYTAEQLAEMVVKLQEQTEILQEIATEKERKLKNIDKVYIIVKGVTKEYPIEEINKIVRAYEEIKICKETNKECNTILPAEYLKVLSLNQTVSKLQSEVEKCRKAFEDAKKERDCQIAEYQKKIEELEQKLKRQETAMKYAEEYVENLKSELKDLEIKIEEEYKPLEIDVERLRKNERELSEENAELYSKIKKSGSVSDFLPTEPICMRTDRESLL